MSNTKTNTKTNTITDGAAYLHSEENRIISLDSLRRVDVGDLFTVILTTGVQGSQETMLMVCESRTMTKGCKGSTVILARPVGRVNAALREFRFTVSMLPSNVLLARRTSDGTNARSTRAGTVQRRVAAPAALAPSEPSNVVVVMDTGPVPSEQVPSEPAMDLAALLGEDSEQVPSQE